MSRDDFLRNFPEVSHETLERLTCYEAMLLDWNSRINLIAPSTAPQIWTRHFMDSYQLLSMIPNQSLRLADIGSGAGFPGLVLACAGMADVHLIESIGKKANFLREVARELGLPVTVHNERAEKIKDLKADIITARAVAALGDLLPLAYHLGKAGTVCLLMKGKTAPDELTESRKYWTFDCESTTSISDTSGMILTLRNLKNRGSAIHKMKPNKSPHKDIIRGGQA